MAKSTTPKQKTPKPKTQHEEQQDRDDPEMRALLDELSAMTPLNAVQGNNELHNFLGARVLEHTTSTGRVLAIKANMGVTRSEADMMHYAATHGVLGPRVHAVYDIIVASSKRTPLMLAMVMALALAAGL
jgi:hypothetical protein